MVWCGVVTNFDFDGNSFLGSGRDQDGKNFYLGETGRERDGNGNKYGTGKWIGNTVFLVAMLPQI